MKKYFLLLYCAKNMFLFTILTACPCEFSLTDPRPFFEQYEKEAEEQQQQITDTNENTKEEKS